MPSVRKDLTLDMRRREDAEGERRIMGSGRRPGLPDLGRATRVEEGAFGLGMAEPGLVLWRAARR